MTPLTQYCDTKNTNIFGFTGNIVPHTWYTQITSDSGRPDHNAISIFSEIVYWYRPSREGQSKFADDIWQTSYKHFETRFGYNNQRTRRALIRLEELGLIRREFRTIEKYGHTLTNVLFIRLISMPQDNSIFTKPLSNEENYDNVCPQMNSGELVISDYIDSCSSLDEKTNQYNEEQSFPLEERDNTTRGSSNKMYLPLYKFDTPSLQICREHIDIENKRENKERRSDQRVDALSIYSFSSLDEESICLNEISEKAKKLFGALASKDLKSKPLDWEEGRVLSQLSDISEEEKDILNKRSGREFSVNFINQLVLKLGVKCPEHRFVRRKQFMNYMVKALMNEILQAPQANNEDFKFACLPKTEEEQYLKQVHKYLDPIESSTHTTPEMTLKKKILGKLEPRLAYEILSGTSLSVSKTGEVDDNDIELMELEIKILRPLKVDQQDGMEIPGWIEQILLEEVRGIYGEGVASIIVKNISNTDNYWGSGPKEKPIVESSTSNPIWNIVRNRLKDIYGSATDRSWFSKLQILDAKLDDKSSAIGSDMTLMISAPTSFMRDWVNINYRSAIEQELKQLYPDLRCVEFVCD